MIEVKGCWNADWPTAMRSQLADDYMAASGLTHGLYLLGWFDSDAWESGAGRSECRGGRESALRQLEKMASELSIDGRRVSAYVMDTALRAR